MMATNVNVLDRAPQAVFSLLNRVLSSEDPIGLSRPLWRDSSRYQGQQNFMEQAANGVWGNIFRAAISWGYTDPTFATNWAASDGVIRYRSSYHVIYPDQPIQTQWENWVQAHPKIDVIPRVIDLELDRGAPSSMIARQVLEMSDRAAQHDGVRPIIYSRRLLINDWLSPFWDPSDLNGHYYWLAQYFWDRTREHPGPPTLPNGVDVSRVILHQTADKKPTPTGEAESKSIDWNRWEIGNTQEMKDWINETWGDNTPPPPDPGLEKRVDDLEIQVDDLETQVAKNTAWIDGHDHDDPPPVSDTIRVKAVEQFATAVAVEHDDKCPGMDPPGKPTLIPKDNKVVIKKDQVIFVKARAAYSCKDDPSTPVIFAAGRQEYYTMADGQPGAGQFIRKDKVEVVVV